MSIRKEAQTSLPLRGTPYRAYVTASQELVATPGVGKKLRIYAFYLVAEEAEILKLRYGGVNGTVFAVLPTKGVVAMNLVNVAEYGSENQNIYLDKSGSGNALAIVWCESIDA